jgi:aminobutyraldehyde dehydrogenase
MTELKMFIDDRWTAASDGSTSVIINPATEEPLASVPEASLQDVNTAVQSARIAFQKWSEMTPGNRSALLLKLADRVEAHAAELTTLESKNVGKPLDVAKDDVEFAVDNLRFFAGAGRLLEGRAAGEYLSRHTSLIRREPLGVVASILPWNYPLLMAIWKMGPALAVGNTVVVKPSELTPLTALQLAQLSAGILPPGVLNVITGKGDTVGAGLVGHPDVAMVSLTGDVDTGRRVLKSAAQGLKKVHLELGGKAPAIVFADADLEWAAQRLRRSGYYNTGQDCTAVTRILVQRTAAEKLVTFLLREIEQMKLGDPLHPSTTTGPLVSKAQQDKVATMVARSSASGGEIVVGGSRREGKGYFYLPTVIAGVQQCDEIVQKEVFGPVLTVQTFEDELEALALANGVAYGLTASVWTQDVSRALRMSNKLQFGTVWINDHTRLSPEMPHGGGKSSGHGTEMSIYALEEYTQVKHVMLRF